MTFYQDTAKTQREILDLSISAQSCRASINKLPDICYIVKTYEITLTLVDVKGETIDSFKFDNGSDNIVTINGNELKR